MRSSLFVLVSGLSLVSLSLTAQTTQGLISGRVVDSLSGNPIKDARIVVFSPTTNVSRATNTDASGFYVLPMLSPGIYQVNAEAVDFQTSQVNELELAVAATLTLPFRLRALSNVFGRKEYRSVFFPGDSVLLFYGPDVDTSRTDYFEPTLGMRGMLETSISHVIDPGSLRELPLARRDVYALLVTLPGVTTDTSTGRGLGISVNGQRPSSSNFLLDGMENNNYLITGPLASVAPEAVQEYRISTNNYSAEYGGTSGFLANAVTRTGGNQWHGIGYLNFQNEALNANDYQRNTRSLARALNRNWQPGFSGGGPLRRPRLFASGSFEYQRFRGAGDPEELRLPTRNFVPQSEFARELLSGFDAPEGPGQTRVMTLTPPSSLDRYFVVPRVDYLVNEGTHRFLARTAAVDIERPDFMWTPYRSFSSPLTQQVVSAMGGWLGSFGGLTNEARAGWSSEGLRFDRAQPEIPVLASEDQTFLPGSPGSYSFRNRSRAWEFVENLSWVHERHTLKFGGGGLFRSLSGYMTSLRDGAYTFADLASFGRNEPDRVRVALSRVDFPAFYRPPDYDRKYRSRQAFFFAQDSFRATDRLVVNAGVRYENFGAPSNVGSTKDSVVMLGNGSSFADALRGAWVQPGPVGDQPMYGAGGNWAVRAGASWSLRDDARTLLRASYGVFHDRPFDNLWQNLRNNSVVLPTAVSWTDPVVAPVAGILHSLEGLMEDVIITRLYMFPTRLETPRTHNYFAGMSHELTRSLIVEANAFGALGRDLITTDLVNRDFSDLTAGGRGRFKNSLPVIHYRSNEGFSDYHGLGIAARYRTRRVQLHLAYTWGHSIDNQSDPLVGDFYDLILTRPGANSGSSLPATFSEQFNANGDRGNSDFDQRHNFAWFGIWELPQPLSRSLAAAFLRNWRVSTLMAFRTGFPYTVTTPSSGPVLNRRADLVNPSLLDAPRRAAEDKGGVRFFDPDAFARPPGFGQGNTGRNAFRGPGFYSIDFSVSGTWPWRALGEGGRVTLRADVFNLLNHANLGNPEAVLTTADVGIARYGRKGRRSSFPALTPFNETARQLQLLLRIEF